MSIPTIKWLDVDTFRNLVALHFTFIRMKMWQSVLSEMLMLSSLMWAYIHTLLKNEMVHQELNAKAYMDLYMLSYILCWNLVRLRFMDCHFLKVVVHRQEDEWTLLLFNWIIKSWRKKYLSGILHILDWNWSEVE